MLRKSSCSEKICIYSREKCVKESLLSKIACERPRTLKIACETFSRKGLRFGCFHINLVKFFRKVTFETFKRRLPLDCSGKACVVVVNLILLVIWRACKYWHNLVKIFKNRPNKICGRQPLKNLKEVWSAESRKSSANFTRSFLEYFVPNNEKIIVPK